ncbi:hypothetical protein [Halomicrococcus sp. NG-SE-24]|uniref:hypothetical protein n=1 Tax=Halomicrococcus sp. NG-SE-24 TaxID=3436928 RepID=UPI003D991AB6
MRPHFALLVAALSGAVGLGYAVGGVDGAATAGVAVALGVGIVVGFLLVASALGATVDDSAPWPAVPVAAVLLAALAAPEYLPAADGLASFERLAAAFLAGGLLLGVAGGDARRGLWFGIVAGGVAGVGYVFVAVHQSFATRPELWLFVLVASVVAPAVGSALAGAGGALGGALGSSFDRADGVADR